MILTLMFGDDEKQATETSTKGVVGHTGKTIPIIPNPKNR